MSTKKIGVVGLRVGRALFDVAAQMPDAEITTVCDIDEEHLAHVAEVQNVSAAFTDLDDLLATDVDVVVLATPIQAHGPQALAAMRAGEHVLCQYVAADGPDEAEALIRVAEDNATQYMFIETDCYERRNMIMQALARAGVFGDLTFGRGHYIHDCKTMGRHPDGTLTWRGELWAESAGARVSAVHNAMPLLEIFGERVAEVYAYGPGPRTMPEFAKHDRVTAVGKLPSGRVIEMINDVHSWCPHKFGYCLQGTRGCFEFDRAAVVEGEKLSDWKDLDALETEYALTGLVNDAGGHRSAWRGCLETFIDAIDAGARPPQDLFDALHVSAIGWAADESLATGRTVPVVQFD